MYFQMISGKRFLKSHHGSKEITAERKGSFIRQWVTVRA